MDEFAVFNAKSAYHRMLNRSLTAFQKMVASMMKDPKVRKNAFNKTPWDLFRGEKCDRLGYDDTFPSSLTSQTVTIYSYWVLVFIGLCCNMVGLRCFLSKEMRMISTNIYLIVLAISDSMYLICVFLSRGLEGIRCLYFPYSDIDIYHQNIYICKALQYLLDLFSDFTSCLILAFTIERYIACYHAVFFRHHCTTKNAKVTCAIIFMTQILAIIPHHIMYMDIRQFTPLPFKATVCIIRPTSEKVFAILYMAEAGLFRITPVVLVAILNVLIIIKVWGVSKKRRLRRSISSAHSRVSGKSIKENSIHDKHSQITFMLILISSCYICFYLPVVIYFIIQKIISLDTYYKYVDQFTIYCNLSRCLYVFGHAVNFFLYTMSGEMFRKQLRSICCWRRQSEETDVVNTSNRKQRFTRMSVL